jgi:hypothetical protein
MQELVNQAFLHVETFGELVKAGRYDLLAGGQIVLPGAWEAVVRPDLSVTMMLWAQPAKPAKPARASTLERRPRGRG